MSASPASPATTSPAPTSPATGPVPTSPASPAAAGAGRRPWQRAIIENVTPQIDGGRFAAKRSVGDLVMVEADAFTDGHDVLRCRLGYRHEGDPQWTEVEMTPLVNDRWRGELRVV